MLRPLNKVTVVEESRIFCDYFLASFSIDTMCCLGLFGLLELILNLFYIVQYIIILGSLNNNVCSISLHTDIY